MKGARAKELLPRLLQPDRISDLLPSGHPYRAEIVGPDRRARADDQAASPDQRRRSTVTTLP